MASAIKPTVPVIVTPEVAASLAPFCRAFSSRWCMQPPEFTDRRGIGSRGWNQMFGDFFRRDYGGVSNPLHLLPSMVVSATTADLEALKAAFWAGDHADEFSKAMHAFLMHQLIGKAWATDQEHGEVSIWIPDWFRAQGWGIPPDWNCEIPPPAYTPLGPAWLAQKGYASAEEAEADLDARLAAGGGAATPPAATVEPAWRQGSCGESGPFIGLSYGHSIELAKRMAAADAVKPGDGRRNAFNLLLDIIRDRPAEPNPLTYTDAEIIDGMGWYSWDPERTRVWIRMLLVEALAVEGIASPVLETLVANPAADVALIPEVVALLTRLRGLGGI